MEQRELMIERARKLREFGCPYARIGVKLMDEFGLERPVSRQLVHQWCSRGRQVERAQSPGERPRLHPNSRRVRPAGSGVSFATAARDRRMVARIHRLNGQGLRPYFIARRLRAEFGPRRSPSAHVVDRILRTVIAEADKSA